MIVDVRAAIQTRRKKHRERIDTAVHEYFIREHTLAQCGRHHSTGTAPLRTLLSWLWPGQPFPKTTRSPLAMSMSLSSKGNREKEEEEEDEEKEKSPARRFLFTALPSELN